MIDFSRENFFLAPPLSLHPTRVSIVTTSNPNPLQPLRIYSSTMFRTRVSKRSVASNEQIVIFWREECRLPQTNCNVRQLLSLQFDTYPIRCVPFLPLELENWCLFKIDSHDDSYLSLFGRTLNTVSETNRNKTNKQHKSTIHSNSSWSSPIYWTTGYSPNFLPWGIRWLHLNFPPTLWFELP